jgi:hypothetical protein
MSGQNSNLREHKPSLTQKPQTEKQCDVFTFQQERAMQDTSKQYINESQQRLLLLLKALAGHEINGLSPAEIKQRIDIPSATLTRDLENLKHAGWAENVPTAPDRVRLSKEPIILAVKHQQGINAMRMRIDETIKQYSNGQ